MEALPKTVEDLIDTLDQWYPPRNPKPSQDLAHVMYDAGQRSVVEMLRGLQVSEEE